MGTFIGGKLAVKTNGQLFSTENIMNNVHVLKKSEKIYSQRKYK